MSRLKSENIKNWVQIVAIILAGAWAIYQFVYVEVIKPKTADAFLTVDLQLRELTGQVTMADGKQAVSCIESTVSVQNPSDQRVYVPSGYFEIFGDVYVPTPQPVELKPSSVAEAINNYNSYVVRHYQMEKTELIAAGSVFLDVWFDPGEHMSFNRLLYVPAGKYTHLEGNVYLLSGPDAADVTVRHTVGTDFSIDYEIKYRNEEVWLPGTSGDGATLLNSRTDLSTNGMFLPLIQIEPRLDHPERSVGSTTPE